MILDIHNVGYVASIFVPAVKEVQIRVFNGHLCVTLSLMNNNEKVIPDILAMEGILDIRTDYRQHIHDMHIHIAEGYSVKYSLPMG